MVETKATTNQDLYLRGKATILEDRNKKKETTRNITDKENIEEKNIVKNSIKEQPEQETENVPMKETEEMLKRMNEYLEEQKRKMKNKY